MTDYRETELALADILKSIIFAAGEPVSVKQIYHILKSGREALDKEAIQETLKMLMNTTQDDAIALHKSANGYYYQIKADYAPWVKKLWEHKPPRYSRAVYETLALIAYRQPITRAEIEAVRGVGVSTQIIKTLIERNWIRVIAHKDVPGKPALYATTKDFLHYFDLDSIKDLPDLANLRALDEPDQEIVKQLELQELMAESEAQVAERTAAKVEADADPDPEIPQAMADLAEEHMQVDSIPLDTPEDESVNKDTNILQLVKMAEALDAKLEAVDEAVDNGQQHEETAQADEIAQVAGAVEADETAEVDKIVEADKTMEAAEKLELTEDEY